MTASPHVVRNVRRLEWYIRVSAYIVMSAGLFGLFLVVAQAGELSPLLPLGAVLVLVHVVLNIWALHRTISAMHRGEGLGTALRSRTGIGLLISLLVGGVAVVLTLDLSTNLSRSSMGGLSLSLTVAMSIAAAISPLLRWRGLLIADLVAIAINTAVFSLASGANLSTVVGFAVGSSISVIGFVGTIWLSAWMLRVLWELDELRQTAPQLAIAEERLRFSRDLHDTFGRTLSVVAVKSELAAELARRGRSEQAAAEIAEVRRIAEEAGREVRAVVSGYRRPELARELDGAKSVLESAGIRCELRTAGRPPGPISASTLGWVVREAVTNVLRHSDATTCWIDLGSTDGRVTLIITNDGVRPHDPGDRGTGLTGLGERVHAVGGTLSHSQVDQTFAVTVSVPDVTLPALSDTVPTTTPPTPPAPVAPQKVQS